MTFHSRWSDYYPPPAPRAPLPLPFSGKAAALATIAVQESAKKVSTWLNGLKAGGVAVVETG